MEIQKHGRERERKTIKDKQRRVRVKSGQANKQTND